MTATEHLLNMAREHFLAARKPERIFEHAKDLARRAAWVLKEKRHAVK